MVEATRPAVFTILLATVGAAIPALSRAQDDAPNGFSRLGAASVSEIDSRERSDLVRIDAYLANRQWEEAAAVVEGLIEAESRRLVAAKDDPPAPGVRRYITLRDACHELLAAWRKMAPEALAAYRRRVDPRAAELWKRATARDPATEAEAALADFASPLHNEHLLQTIVDTMLASSYGDDALDRLAQIALDRGDYATAREHWRAIASAADLDPARVAACLALVSILEGSGDHAETEIEALRRLHPRASGHLAGRDGVYVDILSRLLTESRQWAAPAPPFDWPTFAGDGERNGQGEQTLDPRGAKLWSVALPPARASATEGEEPTVRFDLARRELAYYPVVVSDAAIIFDGRYLSAYDLFTGAARWPVETTSDDQPAGVVFDAGAPPPGRRLPLAAEFGDPSYTSSSDGRRLYVRLGGAVAAPAEGVSAPFASTSLVGLDLPTQRLLFRIEPEGPNWAFEGSPVVRGDTIYVGLRRLGQAQPQAFVAAYDALTGAQQWRSERICSAASMAPSRSPHWIAGLLTLHEGALYYNTQLGAIAALDIVNGRTRWVTAYPRTVAESASQRTAPSPCLYHRGVVYSAPADSDRIFALDAASGRLIWQTRPEQASDAVHLLGVAGDRLIVSGDRLYWLDRDSGRPRGQFPGPWLGGPGLARAAPAGFGRGFLSGGHVYFPTQDAIYVFDVRTEKTAAGWIPRGIAEIDLSSRGAVGGNLAVSDGVLLIASPRLLDAFRAAPSLQPQTLTLPAPSPPRGGLGRGRSANCNEHNADVQRDSAHGLEQPVYIIPSPPPPALPAAGREQEGFLKGLASSFQRRSLLDQSDSRRRRRLSDSKQVPAQILAVNREP